MNGEEAIRRAYDAILKHDFEQAISWFERAIELEPACAAYHYKLSITYARSNKLAKAIHHAREAVRLDPHDEHYLFHSNHLQARELTMQAERIFEDSDGKLWLAVALLKKATELDPLSLEALLLLGVAYSRLNEYHAAVQAVKELLRLDPQHSLGRRLLREYEWKWKQYLNAGHRDSAEDTGKDRINDESTD